MKITTAFLPLFFLAYISGAQMIQWHKNIPRNESGSFSQYLATDSFLNIFLAGGFFGTIEFHSDSGNIVLNEETDGDMFLAKFDQDGSCQWAFNFGSRTADVLYSIETDDIGNVYVTGFVQDPVDLDPGPGVALLDFDFGGFYLAKYDTDGKYLWGHGIEPNAWATGVRSSVAIGPAGEVYFSTYVYDTMDFDPGPGTYNLISKGSTDPVISKYDANGNFIWAKQIGGVGMDLPQHSLVDSDGNLIITGRFKGAVDFDPSLNDHILIGYPVSSGYSDTYIAKYDSSFNLIWADHIKSITNITSPRLGIDRLDNIYIIGTFRDSVIINSGSNVYVNYSQGSSDIVAVKYDGSGVYQWSVVVGSKDSDFAGGIDVDNNGICTIVGGYNDTLVFSGTHYHSTFIPEYNDDGLVVQLNSSGDIIWADSIRKDHHTVGVDVTKNTDGDIFVTGSYITYGDTIVDTISGEPPYVESFGWNLFLRKYSSTTSNIDISDQPLFNWFITPNPASSEITVYLEQSAEPIKLTVLDLYGRSLNNMYHVSRATKIEINHLPAGLYFIKVNSSVGSSVLRFFKE